MAFLAEIAKYLQDNSLGTLGTDLFTGFMPDSPDLCTVIYETGGAAPEGQFGVNGIAFENPSIAIHVRGVTNDYDTPRARIESVYRKLQQLWATTITASGSGPTYYYSTQAIQSPQVLSRDAQNRWKFVVNFRISKNIGG